MKATPDRFEALRDADQRLRAAEARVDGLLTRARRDLAARTQGLSEHVEALSHQLATLRVKAEGLRRAPVERVAEARDAVDRAWLALTNTAELVESAVKDVDHDVSPRESPPGRC